LDHDDREGMEWNIHIVIAENPDNRICFMTSDGPSEANAALIVKACNAWDDPEAMKARLAELGGTDAQFDSAWDAILRCDELKRARERLSIHELRLIIRAAITGRTER
jgi:hypothetical protein